MIFLLLGTFMNLYGYFTITPVWTMEHWVSALAIRR